MSDTPPFTATQIREISKTLAGAVPFSESPLDVTITRWTPLAVSDHDGQFVDVCAALDAFAQRLEAEEQAESKRLTTGTLSPEDQALFARLGTANFDPPVVVHISEHQDPTVWNPSIAFEQFQERLREEGRREERAKPLEVLSAEHGVILVCYEPSGPYPASPVPFLDMRPQQLARAQQASQTPEQG